MSRAFIKEDAVEDASATRLVAPLPEGAVNYVTARGLKLLQAAVSEMEESILHEINPSRQSQLRHAVEELRYRALTAQVIDLSAHPPDTIRFGAVVTLQREGQPSTVKLVGVDEADPVSGLISFYGALAQALVGKRIGDTVPVEMDGREVTWEVVSVSY